MLKLLTPIILILASVGIFVGYIDPTYQAIQADKATLAGIQQQLANSADLQAQRDKLRQTFNNIPADQRDSLSKALPDSIDNVRLIININQIAARYGMSLKNIQVGAPADTATQLGPDATQYGSIDFKFSVSASYENFLSFLQDLEHSLRIVDITSLNVKSQKLDYYDYDVALKTYWLKK